MNGTFIRIYLLGIFSLVVPANIYAENPPTAQPILEGVNVNPPLIQSPPTKTSSPVSGADLEKIRVRKALSTEEIDVDLAIARDRHIPWSMPGLSATIPSGFGADWGVFFAGLGYLNRARYGKAAAGVPYLGAGFWDARRAVGIDVLTNITNSDQPTDGIAFSFRVSRILTDTLGIAAGIQNGISFGRKLLEVPSPYLMMTKLFRLRKDADGPLSLLAVHFGAGSGIYGRAAPLLAGERYITPLGGIGLRVLAPLAVSFDYNGADINGGLSVAPFRSIRVVVSATFYDLTGRDGDSIRMGFSVAFGDSIYSRTFPYLGEGT